MTLTFYEPTHSYLIEEEPETKLTSISTLISKYHEKFDAEAVSKKVAAKRGVDQQELLNEWTKINKDAVDRGHKFHAFKEEQINKLKNTYPAIMKEDKKIAYDITELRPGIYTELIVYDLENDLVGTADYVEIFKDKTFIIKDYKTNKELKFKSPLIFDPRVKERKPKRMFTPLQHLDDCNGIHYTIQLSSYAYMLEKAGYKCKGLELLYVTFEDDEPINITPYPLNYLRNEVKSLCSHFKNSKH